MLCTGSRAPYEVLWNWLTPAGPNPTVVLAEPEATPDAAVQALPLRTVAERVAALAITI